jgi:hypothetical protein
MPVVTIISQVLSTVLLFDLGYAPILGDANKLTVNILDDFVFWPAWPWLVCSHQP